MKKVKRLNVFETNSSSCHSFCICTENDEDLEIPARLYVCVDEFGWEVNKYSTPKSKMSYLYTVLLSEIYEPTLNKCKKKVSEIQNMIYEKLLEVGCEADFEEVKFGSFNSHFYVDGWGIDHGNEVNPNMIRYVLKNLTSYLFDNRTFILTANDNGDYSDYLNIDVDYEHLEFFKGN